MNILLCKLTLCTIMRADPSTKTTSFLVKGCEDARWYSNTGVYRDCVTFGDSFKWSIEE